MKITSTFRFLAVIIVVVLCSLMNVGTSSAACNLPTGLNNTTIAVNSAKFRWTSVVADSFLVRYNIAGSTAYIYQSVPSPTATSVTITGLYPATNYEWVVRTYCTGGTAGGYQAVPDRKSVV